MTGEPLAHLAFFCRLATGLLFGLSAATKARDIPAFYRAIEGFRLLPGGLVRLAAWAFLLGEGLVAALMLLGRLRAGFLLALVLLTVFSFALASVLLRGLRAPCNCFGAGRRPVSGHDLARSLAFLVVAAAGWLTAGVGRGTPDLPQAALLAVMAAAVVLFWIGVGEVAEALRS